jgi:hypothetical protein
MSQTLENTRKRCEHVLADIEAASKENQFYRRKFEAIKELLATRPPQSRRVATVQAIVSEMEPGVVTQRTVASVPQNPSPRPVHRASLRRSVRTAPVPLVALAEQPQV